MKDEDLHFLLGAIKADVEHIKKTLDSATNDNDELKDRVNILETWRNGLVVASSVIVTVLVGLGVSIKSVLAAITHHQ